jgi:hypothetical protein
LNINGNDLMRVTICETAEERAKELPLTAGLVRTDNFAIDDAIGNGPVHPARVRQVLVLDSSPAPSCLEGAQLARSHRIDECFVKMRASAFDNLKPDHGSAVVALGKISLRA